jgi:hypothetical protein
VVQRTDGLLCAPHDEDVNKSHQWRTIMGKYFLAWIMGVPAIVLVLLYFFFH